MFAILEILPRASSNHIKFREKRKKPEMFLDEIQGGESFKKYYILRVREGRGGIPWEEIEEVCGRCKNRLIVQEHIDLPENSGLKKYTPTDFPAILMLNTAQEILKRLFKKTQKISCCIIDKNANAAHLIEKLIPYTSALKVYTDNINAYANTASSIFENFGASLIVSDEFGVLENNLLTISLNNDPGLYPSKGFILSYRRQKDGRTLALGKIDLPAEYYLPPIEGIKRFDFICALYELAGAVKLGEVYTDTLFYSSREINIKSVPELLSINA